MNAVSTVNPGGRFGSPGKQTLSWRLAHRMFIKESSGVQHPWEEGARGEVKLQWSSVGQDDRVRALHVDQSLAWATPRYLG